MEGDGDGGDLCPVRLRLTLPDRTVVDTFLWQTREGPAQMARFAEGYCKDSGLPLRLSGPIAKEIERQVEEWRGRTAQLAAPPERLEVVRLECAVGMMRYTDQFLWDLGNPNANPEQFAAQVARDLGLEGAWALEIACQLREQLAQLCRQGPKQRSSSQPILVSAAPAGEELMHATRSHKRKRAGQAQAEAGAAGPGAPGMRSVHFARCVRPPEQWEEWGPEVRLMSTQEALEWAAAQRQRAEGQAAADAAAASVAAAAEAKEQAVQPEAAPSPLQQPAGEAEQGVRQLRPRRTARLTELMMSGGDSPRASAQQQGTPSAGPSRSMGGAPGSAPGAAAAATVTPPDAAPMPPLGLGLGSLSVGSGGLLLGPQGPPSGAGLPPGLGLPPVAGATAGGGPGDPAPTKQKQLTARQQAMLLQRRQMLLNAEAQQERQQAAGRAGGGMESSLEQEFSGTLSQQYSALLRMHAQDALNTSQVLPSPVFSAAAAAAAGHLFDSAQQAPGASAGFPTSQAQQLLGRQQQMPHQSQMLPPELRSGGLLTPEMRASGMLPPEMRSGGLMSPELRSGGVPPGFVPDVAGSATAPPPLSLAAGGGPMLMPPGSGPMLAPPGSGPMPVPPGSGPMPMPPGPGLLVPQPGGGGGGGLLPLRQVPNGVGGGSRGGAAPAQPKRRQWDNLFGEMFDEPSPRVPLEQPGPATGPKLGGEAPIGFGSRIVEISGNFGGLFTALGGSTGLFPSQPSATLPLPGAGPGPAQLEGSGGGGDVELLGNIPNAPSMYF